MTKTIRRGHKREVHNPFKMIEELGIEPGDLIDFGDYGQAYVTDSEHPSWGVWCTKNRADRYECNPRGSMYDIDDIEGIIEKGNPRQATFDYFWST